MSTFETIRAEVMKFLEDNPKSYSGKGQVINCSAGDPMKIQLGFFFEYCHCGEVPLNRLPTIAPSNFSVPHAGEPFPNSNPPSPSSVFGRGGWGGGGHDCAGFPAHTPPSLT